MNDTELLDWLGERALILRYRFSTDDNGSHYLDWWEVVQVEDEKVIVSGRTPREALLNATVDTEWSFEESHGH